MEKIEGVFTDPRDGKVYKTVKIGKQIWMAENLNYEAEGSRCYGDVPANGEKYGRLYHSYAAKEACPPGWHLPSEEEWETLVGFVGGKEIAGKKLKATISNGTDEFGFSALLGGHFYDEGDYFIYLNGSGNWWSANTSYFWFMERGSNEVVNHYSGGTSMFSIRCVKD